MSEFGKDEQATVTALKKKLIDVIGEDVSAVAGLTALTSTAVQTILILEQGDYDKAEARLLAAVSASFRDQRANHVGEWIEKELAK